MLLQSESGRDYLEAQDLSGKMQAATHLVWATGGSMVPPAEMQAYYQKGLVACG